MQHLGKYEILSEIGRGGMGVVYKARDTLIGRNVALKTISRNVAERPELLARFYQEARSAGGLQHPNIVTIFELGEQDGAPFIAMEYLEGETLERLIARRAVLPLLVKLGYIVRVSEALSHAHKHGVIHRDIKPANIIVTTDGVVKVVDFGIARVVDLSVTQPNLVMGSRGYMAPQLYSGERADARSDIWALGATFYELLTYEKPFAAETEAQLMFKVLHEEPPPLRNFSPDCPEVLQEVVKRMLDKSASARYQKATDVIHDLGPLWKKVQDETMQQFLARSRQLIEVGDLHGARDLLNKTLQIDITSTAAKSLLERVAVEIRRLEVVPRIEEYVACGRQYLSAGKLVEARRELELARGMDSQYEATRQLEAEIEKAAKAAEQLEQQLRFASQRLLQGALTEVEEVLKNVTTPGTADDRVERLRRQLADERTKRERRKRVADFLRSARASWVELKYLECLQVLEDGLREFPGERELLDLQATAGEDWIQEQRQRTVEQTRRLVGQQRFAEARQVLEAWAQQHEIDMGLANLRTLIEQGDAEQKRQARLERELSSLRELAGAGKFEDVLRKGEALLLEFAQEFQLKEFVEYAKAELAQRRQREAEQDREKQVQMLLRAGRYAEAAAAAGVERDLAGSEAFRKFQQELQREQKKQSFSEGTKPQTQAQFDRTERKLNEIQTLVAGGGYDEATLMLNDAFATQILEPSNPRANELLTQIVKMTRVVSAGPNRVAAPMAMQPAPMGLSEHAGVTRVGVGAVRAEAPPDATASPAPARLRHLAVWLKARWTRLTDDAKSAAAKAEPFLKSCVVPTRGLLTPRVMIIGFISVGCVGATSIGVLSLRSIRRSHQLSIAENALRVQAEQLWSQRQPDQAEEKWKQIQALHGALAVRATREISNIEKILSEEQQLFSEGERLLDQDKGNLQAARDLQQVADMGLWHSTDARSALNRIQQGSQTGLDLAKKEQQLFDEGERLFQKGSYDGSQRRFRDLLNLQVPNSTLRPKAQAYLTKIRATNDDKKNYDAALDDLQNENWDAAEDGFRQIVDRKGTLSEEARKQLETIVAAQHAIASVQEETRAGSYLAAKDKLGAVKQWPKSFDRLQNQLLAAEQQELNSFKSRSQALLKNQDAAGLEHLQDDLNIFSSRVQEASIRAAANGLEDELSKQVSSIREQQSTDNLLFEKAMRDFEQAKEQGDINRLKTDVSREFEQAASLNGFHHDLALQYVNTSIPAAMRDLTQALSEKKKAAVPPISCGSAAHATAAAGDAVWCADLDSDAPLQWIGTPTVDVPSDAKKAVKLPYTLRLTLFVDSHGNVKRVDKDGSTDQDFFKKAKDASRQWKTTQPKLNGKAVNADFPLTITFLP